MDHRDPESKPTSLDPAQSPDDGGSIDYKQLALFSIIIAELTVLPGGMGGLAYYLTRDRDPLGVSWKIWTIAAAGIGFGIAFYRIFLLTKQKKKNG